MVEAGAYELCIDSGVVRKSAAKGDVSIVELICEDVLNLEALGLIADLPEFGGIVESCFEGRDGITNRVADVGREGNVHVFEEYQHAGAGLYPG